MEERIFEMLEALALKLGTTVEYLWAVLIKQAYVRGVEHFLWATCIAILAYIVLRKYRNKIKEEEESDECGPWDKDTCEVAWGSFYVFVIIAVFVSAGLFFGCAKRLVNPGYYALGSVLEKLGG